jgi:hypothetical protein
MSGWSASIVPAHGLAKPDPRSGCRRAPPGRGQRARESARTRRYGPPPRWVTSKERRTHDKSHAARAAAFPLPPARRLQDCAARGEGGRRRARTRPGRRTAHAGAWPAPSPGPRPGQLLAGRRMPARAGCWAPGLTTAGRSRGKPAAPDGPSCQAALTAADAAAERALKPTPLAAPVPGSAGCVQGHPGSAGLCSSAAG